MSIANGNDGPKFDIERFDLLEARAFPLPDLLDVMIAAVDSNRNDLANSLSILVMAATVAQLRSPEATFDQIAEASKKVARLTHMELQDDEPHYFEHGLAGLLRIYTAAQAPDAPHTEKIWANSFKSWGLAPSYVFMAEKLMTEVDANFEDLPTAEDLLLGLEEQTATDLEKVIHKSAAGNLIEQIDTALVIRPRGVTVYKYLTEAATEA